MGGVTRRSVLSLTSAGLAAALTGCHEAAAAHAGAKPTARPTTQDWIAFARTVKGPVDLPGSAPYNRTKLVFDTRFDGNKPAAVMVVQRSADIARAMKFAARFGLQVSARSGGHSYVGASAANGTLILDLRDLRSISYDARTHSVLTASGASLYAVKQHLSPYGRGLPTGTCPTVGVAGLTLGGGLGVESRAHGLTADRLLAAQLVLPDGRTVTASAAQHNDIFWAVRGGGGGNIGIVTAMRFATHAATGKGICTLTFAGTDAAKVVVGWANWIRSTTRNRWAGVHVDAVGGGRLHVSIVGVTEAGDEHAAAQSLARTIGVSPTATSFRRLSYLDAAVYLGGGTTSPRQGFTGGSDILRTVDIAAARAITDAVVARSRAGGAASALLDPLTGAVADPATSATAFPWRDHTASVQWYVGGSDYASARSWIAQAHRDVAALSEGGYVNYLEPGQSPHRYFAGNTARLAQVCRTYDPSHRIHTGLPL